MDVPSLKLLNCYSILFSFQTRIICTVKNARIVTFVLFLFVFGARSHFLVYSKKVFDNLYVCWQIFNSVSDEKWVLAVESMVGYSVVFVVFVENIILIVILASRKTIQVNMWHRFTVQRKMLNLDGGRGSTIKWMNSLPLLPKFKFELEIKTVWIKNNQKFSRLFPKKIDSGAFALQSSNDQKEKQLRELTQLCLSIGILFLVCESPRTILPIYHRFVGRTLTSRLIANISYILTAFDHSMNFFIYVLRGERFRKDLFNLMPCCRYVFGHRHQECELRPVSSVGSISRTTFSNVVSETDERF